MGHNTIPADVVTTSTSGAACSGCGSWNTLNFETTFRYHTYFGDEEGHPFACRDMVDVDELRAVLEVVPAERVTLTTDCAMKQLPLTVARAKLASLAQGAAIVRAELEGSPAPQPSCRG